MTSSPRVLSIQSHVVSGYVGNKSASFPLQVLGFEVDSINSVQFSNHTGYRHFKGQVMHAKELEELVSGLQLNNIQHYTHVLTGYIGCVTFLEKVYDTIQDLKKVNPGLIYVCDPVMGDNGKMYVPETLLPVYKEKFLSLADIITPNQYEAELLTGTKIASEEDALAAMELLHSKGAQTVVLTSTELGSDGLLICLGSSIKGGERTAIRLEIPKFPATFTGTGDLFAALLLAWMYKTNNNLQVACERTVATMQDVLARTYKSAIEAAGADNTPTAAQIELKLIQSKRNIEEPRSEISSRVLLNGKS